MDENLTSACNVQCGCNAKEYEPVCGANSITYFSACHAGCDNVRFYTLEDETTVQVRIAYVQRGVGELFIGYVQY